MDVMINGFNITKKVDLGALNLQKIFSGVADRRALIAMISQDTGVFSKMAPVVGAKLNYRARVDGASRSVSGEVFAVLEYADGRVICLIPDETSIYHNWPLVPVWQSTYRAGSSGIICIWKTAKGRGCPLTVDAPNQDVATEKPLICDGALRDGHVASPWDDLRWFTSNCGPWVLIRAESLASETEVTLCAASFNREYQPPYARPQTIRVMSRITGMVNIAREYQRALNVVHARKPYDIKSLLAGIFASGRMIYELYPSPDRAIWSAMYHPSSVKDRELDWHAFFLGYHLGRGTWGKVARFCHHLAYHTDIGVDGVYDHLIPAFAKMIYEAGRSEQTLASFTDALSKNWFQGA